MAMTGFSIGELNNLVPAAAGLTEDDAVPAPPDTPVTVLGDCWLLGPNHRVLCGDSTSVDAVARLCAPGLANLVFTDPRYNVDYEGSTALGKSDPVVLSWSNPRRERHWERHWERDVGGPSSTP